jgi:hypothetical protein
MLLLHGQGSGQEKPRRCTAGLDEALRVRGLEMVRPIHTPSTPTGQGRFLREPLDCLGEGKESQRQRAR